MKKYALLGATAFILGSPVISSSVNADEFRIPIGQQAQDKKLLAKPHRGMQRDEVIEEFGEPSDWTDAVGEPAISSLIYPDYIVYLENNIVLHVVLLGTAKVAD